jgi:hypothetical protein
MAPSVILKLESYRYHRSDQEAAKNAANELRGFQTVIASHRLGARRRRLREAIQEPRTPHDGLLRRKVSSQ